MTDQNQLLREALQELLSECEEGLATSPLTRAKARAALAQPAPGVPTLSKNQIREVFLSHGFTIKEGQTDLKPYVYDAADALLKLAYAALAAQTAEGGEAREFFAYHSDMGVEFFNGPDAEAAAKSLCDENLKLERAEAESTDEWADDRAESIRWGVVLGRAKFFENPGQGGEDSGDYKMVGYTTPPASQEQAQQPGVCTACVMPEQCAVDIAERGPCSGGVQQPSTQAWANETGLRQIECPSCGDLAVAYDPQQPSGEVVAWRTFDGEGGYDYRDFEGNENYADEWAKRNPQYKEWVEPLTLATHKPGPMAWQPIETAPKDGTQVLAWNQGCGFWVAEFRLPMYGEPQNQTHYAKEWRDSGGRWANPTHWMPLPPAPIKEQA